MVLASDVIKTTLQNRFQELTPSNLLTPNKKLTLMLLFTYKKSDVAL